jgi:hypothetical protein
MDGFLIVVWAVRLLFLGLIYLFLARVIAALLRDLRAAAREPGERPGRLVVLASPSGEPPAGQSFGLDVITALGRDVNNAIVIDDPFASAEHAVLTYRGGAGISRTSAAPTARTSTVAGSRACPGRVR